MKRNKLSIIYTLFFLLIFSRIFPQNYSWPVKEQYNQHSIAGTIAEFRDNPPHFHLGVDISNGSGQPVYATDSGKIIVQHDASVGNFNSNIEIRNIYGSTFYWHTNSDLKNGTDIKLGVQIGTSAPINLIGFGPHVHLQKGSRNKYGENTILTLMPYSDQCVPKIKSVNFFKNKLLRSSNNPQNDPGQFSEYSTVNNIKRLKIYSKVDILADVTDPRTNSTGNCNNGSMMPYSTSFQILDSNNVLVSGPFENMKFDKTPISSGAYLNIAFSYDATSSNHKLIISNNPFTEPYDRYWNSNLKKGASDKVWPFPYDENLDAIHPKDAQYSEGLYSIRVITKDIYNAGNSQNTSLPHDDKIVVDNFMPYIDTVIIKVKNKIVYKAYWQWNGTENVFIPNKQNDTLDASTDATVFVYTSEPMSEMNLAIPELNVVEPVAMVLEDDHWKYVVTKQKMLESKGGSVAFSFTGKDYANNPLIIVPEPIYRKNIKGNWVPDITNKTGADKNHSFELNFFDCINPITITCGIPIDDNINSGSSTMTHYPGLNVDLSGNEKVYSFTTAQVFDTIAIRLEVEDNLGVFIFNSCAPMSLINYSYIQNVCGSTCSKTLYYNNALPGTYYIVIDGNLPKSISVPYKLTVLSYACGGFRPGLFTLTATASCFQGCGYPRIVYNWTSSNNATSYSLGTLHFDTSVHTYTSYDANLTDVPTTINMIAGNIFDDTYSNTVSLAKPCNYDVDLWPGFSKDYYNCSFDGTCISGLNNETFEFTFTYNCNSAFGCTWPPNSGAQHTNVDLYVNDKLVKSGLSYEYETVDYIDCGYKYYFRVLVPVGLVSKYDNLEFKVNVNDKCKWLYERTPDFEITPVCSCPLAPNQKVTNITSTSAKIQWTASSLAEGYIIEYKRANLTYFQYAEVDANSTSVNLTNLDPGTQYQCQVAVICDHRTYYFTSPYPYVYFTTASTSIDKINEKNVERTTYLNLQPNPVDDVLTFDFALKGSNITVQIINMFGTVVFQKQISAKLNQDRINVNNLRSGIYSLLLKSSSGSIHKSFVKK